MSPKPPAAPFHIVESVVIRGEDDFFPALEQIDVKASGMSLADEASPQERGVRKPQDDPKPSPG